VEFTDTMDALRSGISMIHQELNLVPHMTVAENIRAIDTDQALH
jgi:inositol transport system ATP-binding protein